MARGLIDKLMAQAEAAARTESVAPPKSGERPAVREPVKNELLALDIPTLDIPTPPAIPRIYSDDDDGENLGPRQSGATRLLEVNVVKAPPVGASPAPGGSSSVLPSSAFSVAAPSAAAQIDAYRASLAPARNSSGAKLVLATALLVTLGIVALYVLFATA